MDRFTAGYFIEGTSALEMFDGCLDVDHAMGPSCQSAALESCEPKKDDILTFAESLKYSYISFICDGKLNHGLHYENFSGKPLNRMTTSQAIGSGILFMLIAVMAVFIGI